MLCGLLRGTTVKVVRQSLREPFLSSSQPGGTTGSPSRDSDTGGRVGGARGECVTDLKRGDYEGARSIKNNPAGELYNEAAREVSQKPLTAQRSPVNGKASITLNSHDHCLSVTIQFYIGNCAKFSRVTATSPN